MNYTFMDFINWAGDLSRGPQNCHNILFREGVRDDGKKYMEIEFFTRENRYVVTATETDSGRPLYLDGGLITRAPYPGERHVRFANVNDGTLTPENWTRMLGQIVHYEMLPINEYRDPRQVDEKDKLTLVDALDKYFPGWHPFKTPNASS